MALRRRLYRGCFMPRYRRTVPHLCVLLRLGAPRITRLAGRRWLARVNA